MPPSTPDIDAFHRMTPAKKWRLITSMHVQARRWKRAALKAQHPDWTDAQVDATVRKVFLNGTD